MSAEVIKVERPVAGDAGRASPTMVKGQSGYFLQQNMGKQGPTGHDLPQSTVYGSFSARDGYLVIAAQMTDTWKSLARLIGGDAYAADTTLHSQDGRNANRESILARVSEWTMTHSVEACCAALDAAGVPAAPVQTIDKVLADPQTLARDMVVEQEHPVLGKIRLPNLPFRFSGCDTSPSGPAPLLGQHNREIAESVGYSASDIDAMEQGGVLYSEKQS